MLFRCTVVVREGSGLSANYGVKEEAYSYDLINWISAGIEQQGGVNAFWEVDFLCGYREEYKFVIGASLPLAFLAFKPERSV